MGKNKKNKIIKKEEKENKNKLGNSVARDFYSLSELLSLLSLICHLYKQM